jgi:hypothetical protein
MTMYYTPREDRLLAEDRVKDIAVEERIGRKPASSEERERIWKLIQDAARC